jgi:hypothetical protein
VRLAAKLVAALLLAQMAVAMVVGALGDAPVYDEPPHVAAGLGYVARHSLRLNVEHPPLVKAIAAIPLVAAGTRIPPREAFDTVDQFELGRQIIYRMGNDPDRVMLLARLPMIGLTLLLALAVFGFALDLFGWRGALVSLAVVTLDPNLVGHGKLVTTDVPVAGLLLLTAWMLWRAATRPVAWRWLAAAGVAYGLALSAKYTAVLGLPAVAVLAFAAGSRADARSWWPPRRLARGAAWGAAVLGLAFVIVALVYLAIDPALRYDGPDLAPPPGLLGIASQLLAVPRPYRDGVQFQLLADTTWTPRTSFLLGERYAGGRLAYFPALLVLKTPPAVLALWLASLAALAALAARRAAAAFLLAIPALLLLVAVPSATNIGYRHILTVPVFLAVAAGVLPEAVDRVAARRPSSARAARPVLVAALVAALLGAGVSCWGVHPYQLSYVTELAGGLDAGPALLSDSNVDWGQDAKRLAAWLRARHPEGDASLLYFGTVRPADLGIRARDLCAVPPSEARGTVVASATAINTYHQGQFDYLAKLRPVERIGSSILVFELPAPVSGDDRPPRCTPTP